LQRGRDLAEVLEQMGWQREAETKEKEWVLHYFFIFPVENHCAYCRVCSTFGIGKDDDFYFQNNSLGRKLP